MIVILGSMRFPPENMPQVRPHLQALVETTRRHDNPIAYDVGEDPFDPGLVRFSEVWSDAETLARHINAPHMPAWQQARAPLGVTGREFTIYDVSGSRPL